MSNPNWGERMTTTLAHRRKNISDAISRNNALIAELRRRGVYKTIGGGRTITTPIMIGEENTNFQWYFDRETLNVGGMEVLTSAEFPWKQGACAVSMSGFEMLVNSGAEQIIEIMAQRIKHAEKTIANQMAKSAHGDGTSFSGKEMAGIQLYVSSAAGSTVGGIPSASALWWDNKRRITGAAPATATIYAEMLNLFLQLNRDTDRPNLGISDNTWFSVFSQSLQSQKRYMNERMATAGFTNLMFETMPVVADGNQGGYAPAGIRMLNCETLEILMHRNRNMVVLGGPRRPLTEDSDTAIIAFMGNMIVNNRMLNGVLQQ